MAFMALRATDIVVPHIFGLLQTLVLGAVGDPKRLATSPDDLYAPPPDKAGQYLCN